MKKINIEEFKEYDKRMMRVSLGNDKFAVVSAYDWNELMDLGLSGRWRIGPNDHVVASCNAATNGYVLVARVLLAATERESVIFLDKNPHNLRRSNLKLRYDNRGNLTNSRQLVALSSRTSEATISA